MIRQSTYIVIVKDENAIRVDWQIGQVEKVYCGNDQICRKVDVQYKVPINKKCSIMRRAVEYRCFITH